MKKHILLPFCFLYCFIYAQTTVYINGKVLDAKTGRPLVTATVTVIGGSKATVTNDEGIFVLESAQKLPFKIHVDALEYEPYYYTVTKREEQVVVLLEQGITSLDAVVISASRTPERVFESPVSIERMGIRQVENTTAPNFYDGLENLKGVDVNTSSLAFKSVNTRGFATFTNPRFIQLVDGMDNASPGLNFSLGNLIGLNDLDVQSVELLPGASSALYGANAFNGILLMQSKNPFYHQGIDVYGRTGVTSSENAGVNHFVDAGFRVAKKVNEQFAVKFTASLLQATDWFATDTRNIDGDGNIIDGDRNTAINYNGMNVYGDEFTNPTDIGFGKVSRTGYAEQDLIDPNTDSFRATLSMHLRPFKNEDFEFIYNGKFGTGNTIYHGGSRYALRNFVMHQHKLELKSKHLMLRSYVTVDDAGDSYDIRFAGINTLRAQNTATENYNKANGTSLSVDELWFGTYGSAYQAFRLAGNSELQARKLAREKADADFKTNPNTTNFKNIFNSVISNPDLTKGAKFIDQSKLYHTDINYNFKDRISFAEVQFGASARRYQLDSDGTIFTDPKNGTIIYDEFGVYTQLQKKMIEDKLKITGSIRYDKSENFKGNFSPRFSVSFHPDESKKHHFRASVQTGFRNPTTQDQYIGLYLGNTILIGSAPENPERYRRDFTVSSPLGQAVVGGTSVSFVGTQGYQNSFTRASVEAFVKSSNPADLVAANIDYVKPEKITSYELGYRGKLSKTTVMDASAYYNKYKDFISFVTTIAPLYGKTDLTDFHPIATTTPNAVIAMANGEYTPTSIYTNTDADISSYGLNVGVETKVYKGYQLGINYSYAKQIFDQAKYPDFKTNFNTPEHKVKVRLANDYLYKGLGFAINARWQDAFYWQSAFVDAMISARTLLDAQLTYQIKKWKSKVKIGGANVLAHEYVSAPGTGLIGAQYYASWTCNF